jgi:4-amino-4-deoxy-L-arabinose transferase-like glycosyltransferase
MARHVLHGEFPAFLWGQAFKGVPEVYATAAAFAAAGSSVVALKSVTLALFAAYVALNFVLLDKISGRWLAVSASLLLIVAPPALVFWSLDASAEYMLIMLIGTAFLLLCLKWQETRSTTLLASVGLMIGLAFWIQQIFMFYLIPVALILCLDGDWRRTWRTGRLSGVTLILGTLAMLYLALAVVAFATGGFSLHLATLTLGAHAPQKLLRIGAGVGALAAMSYALGHFPRRTIFDHVRQSWPLAGGAVVGYAPALLYSIFVAPAHSPARNGNLRQLISAAPDIVGNVVPILSGFKVATTERLPIPLMALAPGGLALGAYLWSNRARLIGFARLRPETSTIAGDFFPLFFVCVPLLFLASGAYLDTQSYRYLIPFYAGLSVAWAAGAGVLGNRAVASALVGIMLAVHGWQQVAWYEKLRPDTASMALLDCLRQKGIRGGYADYWTSYTLTFLSHEEIIVAPANGVDRYPAYSAFVRSLPADARLQDVTRCN